VETFGIVGMTTGSFATKMLSMDMTGTVGGHFVEVMLDPSQNTTGMVTISSTPGGPGLYHIDSFFDIFTEISLDHGPFITQTPGSGPTLVQLQTVPEPSTWIMLVAAGVMVPAYGRWSRRWRA
jgi:PEP-CTERM motif